MGDSLLQVDWSVANGFRVATVVIQMGLFFEMVLLLAHYYWRIIPMRRKFEVLAPPLKWSIAYHLSVAVFVATEGISTAQRFTLNAPATVETWLDPLISLALWISVRQFVKYYSVALNQAQTDRYQ